MYCTLFVSQTSGYTNSLPISSRQENAKWQNKQSSEAAAQLKTLLVTAEISFE
jgi:hypothetical protein